MTNSLVKKFADRLFEYGVRTPESAKAVIAFKETVQVTDEMVERACIASTCESAEEWFELASSYRASIWNVMRDALEAALNGGEE